VAKTAGFATTVSFSKKCAFTLWSVRIDIPLEV
jgi:hypothetical protein